MSMVEVRRVAKLGRGSEGFLGQGSLLGAKGSVSEDSKITLAFKTHRRLLQYSAQLRIERIKLADERAVCDAKGRIPGSAGSPNESLYCS